MFPQSRSTDVTVKRMGDEFVVFDARNGTVHHLNLVAGLIWQSCDGRTDRAALARMVAQTAGVPNPLPAVELALEQLSRRGLLETPIERAAPERRRDRREALRMLAKAAAIPVVLTLTANKARANFSTGSPCTLMCMKTIVGPSSSGYPLFDIKYANGVYAPGGITCVATCPAGYAPTST